CGLVGLGQDAVLGGVKMNTYKITLKGYDADGHFTLICAETPGKAKYEHYRELGDLFEDFGHYLRFVENCKCLHKAQKEDYYKKSDSFEETKKYRSIPLIDYGTVVEIEGKRGFIVGDNRSCNFDVKFDNGIFNCHPHYQMVYFDDAGNVLYDFRMVNS
ncbi:hypothetical protein, partial [Anaerotignum propionicum]|uniref:hypothetical protein n=1 Tax=Anaerotignum propionicum TaxID=28446 RepID=UPI0028A08FF7